jgi:hypothetical protein
LTFGAEVDNKLVLYIFDELRTEEKASEPFKVLEPMSKQLKKFIALPFSVGIRSK